MNVDVDNKNNNKQKQHNQTTPTNKATSLNCFSAPLVELFVCLFLAYG